MVGERSTELTTPRCGLRAIATDDAEPLHELWSSPGLRRFLWDDEIIPIARNPSRDRAESVAQAVMTYCFDSLHMPVVRASTDVANTASVRVLEKLGFRFARRSTVGGLPTVFYEMQPGGA